MFRCTHNWWGAGERERKGGETEKLLYAGLVEKKEKFQSPESRKQNSEQDRYHIPQKVSKALPDHKVNQEKFEFWFLLFLICQNKELSDGTFPN